MSVIEKKTSLHIISRVIESENLRHHRQKPQNSPVRNKPSQSDGPTDRQDVFASRNVTQAKDRAVSYDLAYKTNKTFADADKVSSLHGKKRGTLSIELTVVTIELTITDDGTPHCGLEQTKIKT